MLSVSSLTHMHLEKNGISFLRWGTGGLVSNNCHHGVTPDVPDAAERQARPQVASSLSSFFKSLVARNACALGGACWALLLC